VEQLGAGSRPEGVQAFAEGLLYIPEGHWLTLVRWGDVSGLSARQT
jgi:hypothetical protein